MSVNLQKGQKISLTKEQPGLSKVIVGLGWAKASGYQSQEIDCDAMAILLGQNYKSIATDVVFYNHLCHESNAVKHMGDNLTGSSGKKDDEQIVIDLSKMPPHIDRIVIAVNIYQAVEKSQHFGMISSAFIRLVNADSNKEICIYNLSENYNGATAMIFGELYKRNGEWRFNAVGQGTRDGGVDELGVKYGVDWAKGQDVLQAERQARIAELQHQIVIEAIQRQALQRQAPQPRASNSQNSGGCYVATAVYGSYDCPQVWTLRRYRDYTLAETWYGRAFIRTYYAISPTLVKWFGHTNWFKKMWKGKLDRMVSGLNAKGVQDTPYQDRNW